MVHLIIKNLKEVETEADRRQLEELAERVRQKLEKRLKRYGKELTLEVIVNKSSSTYLLSAAVDLRTKRILQAEEGRELVPLAHKLFDEFLRQFQRQLELERKDYEYKRKR